MLQPSGLIQSDGTNDELAYRQRLAVGPRQVCQQAIPHAGFYINCCHRTQALSDSCVAITLKNLARTGHNQQHYNSQYSREQHKTESE